MIEVANNLFPYSIVDCTYSRTNTVNIKIISNIYFFLSLIFIFYHFLINQFLTEKNFNRQTLFHLTYKSQQNTIFCLIETNIDKDDKILHKYQEENQRF